MSATNRSERGGDGVDNFPTPDWSIHRMLEGIPLPGGLWLEPAAGDGQIIRTVRARRPHVEWDAVELRPECKADLKQHTRRLWTADFLQWHPSDMPRYSVVATNPPYDLAQKFVEKSLSIADHVVMLLRLNFLGSDDRAAFMRATCPDVYVLPDRPPFAVVEVKKKVIAEDGTVTRVPTGKYRVGTDATEYGWFVWRSFERRREGRLTVLGSTSREEKRAWSKRLLAANVPVKAA